MGPIRVLNLLMALSLGLFLAHCSKDSGGGGGGGGGSTTPPPECNAPASAAALTQDDVAAEEGTTEEPATSADCEWTNADNNPGQSVTTDPLPAEDVGNEQEEVIPKAVLVGLKEGHGCLQGIVTDGYTGQPIDLSGKLDDPSGLYVLIRNTKLKAQIIPNDANLIGQYFICGIPLEETYPVYAFLDGYYSFESTVNISSTRAGTKADGDVKAEFQKADPISRTNLVMFPTSTGGRDLVVRAYHEGEAVAGAIVDVEPISGEDHFAFEGTFASSANTRLFPMRATTDEDGVATFAADKMAMGHRYKVTITPPEEANLDAPDAKNITFGISGTVTDLDHNNYTLNFNFADAEVGLAIISCSPEGETYNSSGTIQIVFNRDVAIVSPNLWKAALEPATFAAPTEIEPDDAATAGAESVNAGVVGGNTLYLRPKWVQEPRTPDYAKLPTESPNEDRNIKINYDAANMNVTVVGDNADNATALSAITGAAKCNGFSIRMFREFL